MKPVDPTIEGLRGLAVVAVMGCHISKLSSDWNLSDHEFWQGACGAHLLLIISGFSMAHVLAKTATLTDFIVGRLTRIYPMYAVSMLLSVGLIVLFKPAMYRVTWDQVLANLTMCQSWLGQADLDGALWLTGVLLKFYVLVGVAVVLRLQDRVELLAAVYLVIVSLWRVGAELGVELPSGVSGALNIEHAHLLVAGLILWCVREYGQSMPRALIFVACMGLETAGTKMPWGSVVIVCLMLLSFCRSQLPILASRPLCFVGRCSFGVYMLHGVLGYVTMEHFSSSLPIPVAATLSFAVVILAAELLTQMLAPLTRPLRTHFSLPAPRHCSGEFGSRPLIPN